MSWVAKRGANGKWDIAMACGGMVKKRYDEGGAVPWYEQQPGEQDEYEALQQYEDNSIPVLKQMAKKKSGFDLKSLAGPALIGALMGLGGSNQGVAMAPLMALLMGGKGGLGGLFGGASAKTPAFNPNANNPYGDGRGGGG